MYEPPIALIKIAIISLIIGEMQQGKSIKFSQTYPPGFRFSYFRKSVLKSKKKKKSQNWRKNT